MDSLDTPAGVDKQLGRLGQRLLRAESVQNRVAILTEELPEWIRVEVGCMQSDLRRDVVINSGLMGIVSHSSTY